MKDMFINQQLNNYCFCFRLYFADFIQNKYVSPIIDENISKIIILGRTFHLQTYYTQGTIDGATKSYLQMKTDEEVPFQTQI